MMEDKYKIVEIEGKDAIMVAQMDLKPGTHLFDEHEPLLRLTPTKIAQYASQGEFAEYYAAYEQYQCTMTPQQKTEFRNLNGSVSSPNVKMFKKSLLKLKAHPLKMPGFKHSLTTEEKEEFVHIASIFRASSFELEGDKVVFVRASLLSYSCLPNCAAALEPSGRLTCRVILPIKAGEKLSIEYSASLCFCPTYERRNFFLETKDYTCHCPRCDAPGDNTRQFRCSDFRCNGQHLVCHPVDATPPAGMTYTGVKYVEPHLLPCTVCHRPSTPEWEQLVFKIESHLPTMSTYALEQWAVRERPRHSPLEELRLANVYLHKFTHPRYHGGAMYVSLYHMTLRRRLAEYYHTQESYAELSSAALDYARGITDVLTYPSDLLVHSLHDAAVHCSMDAECPTATRYATDILRLALRMHLVLKGRTGEPSMYHKALASILAAKESFLSCCSECADCAGSSEEELEEERKQKLVQCAFCRESPENAAVTLSLCARCKVVRYCSTGCQKAHWKLHKLQCNKECVPGKCTPTCSPGCPYKQMCMLSSCQSKKTKKM